ncbi:MAG: PilC/PilY family type IV pilus protein [Rhodocyclaceae bacterium]|nr:PilC/PilY family type IV pilus protein [Rhodocyclaceae bacterium]
MGQSDLVRTGLLQDKCLGGAPLTQCASFDATQKTQANLGTKMLGYIRGQQEMEITDPPLYRPRDHILGDIASAKPAYVRNPRRNYGDVGYSVFKAAQSGRQAMVYVAANDGYLHALNATTGSETWAYVPHAIYPDLHKLADSNYGNNHRYYVDGSPESGDVYIGDQWRTILVGVLNKGGRGYYALDITEPTNPLVLWGVLLRCRLVLRGRQRPRLHLRQPDHHQAPFGREVGGSGGLRL